MSKVALKPPPTKLAQAIKNLLKSGSKSLDQIISGVGDGKSVMRALLYLELHGTIVQVARSYTGSGDHYVKYRLK